MGKRARTSSATLRNTPQSRRPFRLLGQAARVGAKLLWKNRHKIAQRLRGRKNRIFTKTRRYGKPDDQIEISQHNDMSLKNLGIYKFPGGSPKNVLGTYLYRNIVPMVLQGVAGKQAVDYPEIILTRNMIIGSVDPAFSNRFKLADDLYFLNPFNAIPGSTFYPTPPVNPNDTDYMFIKHIDVQTRFLSMETIPQKVTVYWCTPKFDNDATPMEAWERIINSKNLTQGPAAARSVVTTVNAIGGAESLNTLSSSPWHHAEFRKQWSSIKKQQFVLQPGDQRNLKFKIIYNKAVNRGTFKNIRMALFLKGYSVFPLIIVEGGLIGVGSDVASTASEVTTGPTKVGVLTDYQYVLGALPQSRFAVNRHVDHQIVNPDVSQYQRMIDDTDEIDIIEKL